MLKTKPQYAAVEQPFDDVPTICCPICGKLLVENEEIQSCEHLAFVCLWMFGGFQFQSSDFEKRREKLGDDYTLLELGHFPRFLEKLGYDNKMLAIQITYGSNIESYTDIFGFDYSTMVVAQNNDLES